jgi:hypothetical protein
VRNRRAAFRLPEGEGNRNRRDVQHDWLIGQQYLLAVVGDGQRLAIQ